MEENVNIKVVLSSIEQVEVVSRIDDIDVATFEVARLKFQYKVETMIRPAKNAILVKVSIRYLYEEKQLLYASAVLNFSVNNLSSAIVIDKENLTISTRADIFPSLVGTAYSTLRGIVYDRTGDTFLSKYPMPMVEVATLVSKNGISVEE